MTASAAPHAGITCLALLAIMCAGSYALHSGDHGASALPLTGYFCSTCPSTLTPSTLVTSIHPAYTRVLFAFIGWDANGNVLNQWDDSSKNFTLTASIVAELKKQGRDVGISMGGGAGNTIDGTSPPSFASTLASGIVSLFKELDITLLDCDVENREGDPIAAAAVLQAVLDNARELLPQLRVTFAPQMTDLYPGVDQITLAWNPQVCCLQRLVGTRNNLLSSFDRCLSWIQCR